MIRKIIYDTMLVPKPESKLDMDAVGLLVSMASNFEVDYKDVHSLSKILSVPKKEIETAAKKLVKRGYLKIVDGVYAVNKFKIKDMLLIEPNNNREG